jgi:hypothetical protein
MDVVDTPISLADEDSTDENDPALEVVGLLDEMFLSKSLDCESSLHSRPLVLYLISVRQS